MKEGGSLEGQENIQATQSPDDLPIRTRMEVFPSELYFHAMLFQGYGARATPKSLVP